MVIYITLTALTLSLIVKDRRNPKKDKDGESTAVNPKDKKTALLIVLFTMLFYYILGYILKTDILNVITLRKNGVSFSFIGIILLIITSVLIGYIVDTLWKRKLS